MEGDRRSPTTRASARRSPTIRAITEAGGKAILMSHLGRPKGGPDPKYSLRPVAKHLGELLGTDVAFSEATTGPDAQAAVDALPDGGVLVLENTRFLPGEEKNDEALSRALAALADVYVNDAFGSAHRAHASTEGVARFAQAGSRGAPDAEGSGLPRTPARSTRAPVRGGARRREGVGQDRRHRQPARALRPAPRGRRDGLHAPQGARRIRRRLARGRRPARPRARPARPRGQTSYCSPPTTSSPTALPRTPPRRP